MKRVVLGCEHCGAQIDDEDAVRYEGYLVHVHCRTLNADALSARRVREDESVLAVLAEDAR